MKTILVMLAIAAGLIAGATIGLLAAGLVICRFDGSRRLRLSRCCSSRHIGWRGGWHGPVASRNLETSNCWSEASRNRRMGSRCGGIDCDSRPRVQLVMSWAGRRSISPAVPARHAEDQALTAFP